MISILSAKTDAAAAEFQRRMKLRLAEKQAKYGNDWDEQGAEDRLIDMLFAAAMRHKWIDVANFAMMIWHHEQKAQLPGMIDPIQDEDFAP